ncbi:MAG TPA: hypothetical protein VGJ86_11295 [Acidimicrobiales bacterium]
MDERDESPCHAVGADVPAEPDPVVDGPVGSEDSDAVDGEGDVVDAVAAFVEDLVMHDSTGDDDGE